MTTRPLFPLSLKLENRSCLVVGGASLLLPKLEGLIVAGASIRLVSAEIEDGIRAFCETAGVQICQRELDSTDLDGITLVIAADRDQSINELVFRESQRRGILCNVVDQPALCDFYYPAVVRRGQLQIAISTGGQSPSLASAIRADLEQQFGHDYADWVDALGRARTRIFQTHRASKQRTRLLKRIASKNSFEQFRRSRRNGHQGAA